MIISRKIVLHFPPRQIDQPILYHLVKDYDLQFNILKASVQPNEEGILVLELSGKKKDYDASLHFLTEAGVGVQALVKDVSRKEDRCTHCGACVTMCPVGALAVDPATRRVDFINTKCIACGLCIKPCPVRAMEVRL